MIGYMLLEKCLFLALQGAACGLLSNQQWTQTSADCYIQVSLDFVCNFFFFNFNFFNIDLFNHGKMF